MAKRSKASPFHDTSKVGEFQATTAQLVQALGYPSLVNDHIPGGWKRQTLYEWQIRTGSGPVTIYDFKEWDDPDFPEDKVITWQVGGRANKYTSRPIHPVNEWVATTVGVLVVDTRRGRSDG